MLTPAEELLAAVKEHATAGDRFDFKGGSDPRIIFWSQSYPTQFVTKSAAGWLTSRIAPQSFDTLDPSASSAVYSAFLRARGKQL